MPSLEPVAAEGTKRGSTTPVSAACFAARSCSVRVFHGFAAAVAGSAGSGSDVIPAGALRSRSRWRFSRTISSSSALISSAIWSSRAFSSALSLRFSSERAFAKMPSASATSAARSFWRTFSRLFMCGVLLPRVWPGGPSGPRWERSSDRRQLEQPMPALPRVHVDAVVLGGRAARLGDRVVEGADPVGEASGDGVGRTDHAALAEVGADLVDADAASLRDTSDEHPVVVVDAALDVGLGLIAQRLEGGALDLVLAGADEGRRDAGGVEHARDA